MFANVETTILGVMLVALVVVMGIWTLASIAVGNAAERKDRSFISFFFIALFMTPPVGELIVAAVPPGPDWVISNGRRQLCPDCAEAIRLEAVVCPFWRSDEVAPVDVRTR
jgi:hypothetical protein